MNFAIDETTVAAEAKNIRITERTQRQLKKKKEQDDLQRALQTQQQDEKKKRTVPKGIRPKVYRSTKPTQKKQEEKKQQHEQWQIDMINYSEKSLNTSLKTKKLGKSTNT